MTILNTIILGFVEGITEFLPISSTAHLLIAGKLLQIGQTDFFKSFIIIIQLGAILAVFLIYIKKIFESKTLWKKIAVAWIPTAAIGFLLYQIIKNILFESLGVIAFAMIIGGIVIIIFEKIYKNKNNHIEKVEDISYKKSFWIGLIQALAVVPGVSRSGATIIGGMGLGVSRSAIVEFSFLLAIPTIAAASGYDILKSNTIIIDGHLLELSIGFIVAFISAYLATKFFIKFIKNHSFTSFAIYRIIAGIIILFFIR